MAQATSDAGGLLLLDKPAGISSNQALGKAKRILGIRKAGHAGTLDPFATGMLLCAFGQATKVNAFLLGADKTYQATLKLGQATTTGDPEGEVIGESGIPDMLLQQWQLLAGQLTGDIEQVPPMYSALKHQGQPLYKLARAGKSVERKARRVTIHRLNITAWKPPLLDFEVHCSKGTYVRTLGEQLAELADAVGHLAALRRTGIAPFDRLPMRTLDELEAASDPRQYLFGADQALAGYPAVTLDESQQKPFLHGQSITGANRGMTGLCRVYAHSGQFVGIGEQSADGVVKPHRLFSAG